MIRKLLCLNLRSRIYRAQKLKWILANTMAGISPDEVLEIHSQSNLSEMLRAVSPQPIKLVTFMDAPKRVVTQARLATSVDAGEHPDAASSVFFIDGRRTSSALLVRDVIHLIHGRTRFTPPVRYLSIWLSEVSKPLFDMLDREHPAYLVDDRPDVGLVVKVVMGRGSGLTPRPLAHSTSRR